jgi:hypothetical protein
MPRIAAISPTGIVGVNLDASVYRIVLGSSIMDNGADGFSCFSLLYQYPPATTFAFRPADSILYHAPPATQALVRVPISLAGNRDELDRIAAVSSGSGDQDLDLRRMTEGFELFNNRPGTLAREKLDACIRDAAEVVKAFNQVRLWVAAGMQQEVGIKVTTSFAQKDGQSLETTLRCMP